MQDALPEALAQGVQFGRAVTQLQAQVMVAEQHALIQHVMHVEGVRHRAHHIRPEALTLDQRQFDALAAGDVADAQGHRIQFLRAVRQAQDQPQVTLVTLRGADPPLQFELAGAFEQGREQVHAKALGVQWATVDQVSPGVLGGVDAEQLQGHLVGLGETHQLQQFAMPLRMGEQPAPQARAVMHLQLLQVLRQRGQVQDAERGAGAFEDVLVAPAGFLQDVGGVLLLGDVAQHPDEAQAPRRIAEFAAAYGEQAGHAVLADLHQIGVKVARPAGVVQQLRIEVGQQLQQVPAVRVLAAQTEQFLGLGVEVAQLAIAGGDQHALLDGPQRTGRLAQRAPRRRIEFVQAALFALQAVQGQQGQ
ncbi:hypothetical protein D3C85_516160 [compost metagenome]